MIERCVETGDGIIQVTSVGLATRDDLDAHYDELRAILAQFRAANRSVRVLSDQTRAARLTDELNFHISSQITRTYQPGDRLALLMATQDDKNYVRWVLGDTRHAVFNSRIAAEIWLMEPSLTAPCQHVPATPSDPIR